MNHRCIFYCSYHKQKTSVWFPVNNFPVIIFRAGVLSLQICHLWFHQTNLAFSASVVEPHHLIRKAELFFCGWWGFGGSFSNISILVKRDPLEIHWSKWAVDTSLQTAKFPEDDESHSGRRLLTKVWSTPMMLHSKATICPGTEGTPKGGAERRLQD